MSVYLVVHVSNHLTQADELILMYGTAFNILYDYQFTNFGFYIFKITLTKNFVGNAQNFLSNIYDS